MSHDLRPRCVVCSAELPQMTRAEHLAKGSAIVIGDKTYYKCIGRHTEQEIFQSLSSRPKFTRASRAGA